MRVEKSLLMDAIGTENAMLESSLEACERQISTLAGALSDTGLQSEAYQAIRDRITTLRIPLAKAQHNVFEALHDDNGQNSGAVSALPETSPGVADTDEAQERIYALESANDGYRRQIDEAAALGLDTGEIVASCQPLMEANQRVIDELNDVILQIQAYADASSGYYSDTEAAMQTLAAADQSLTSYLSGGGYGDLSWAETAAAEYGDWQVADRLGVSKADFIEMQVEQFNLDKVTAAIMWEVYARLCERYPKADQSYIDWAWLNLMGSIVYDDLPWKLTAGEVTASVPNPSSTSEADRYRLVSGEEYFTEFLGLSEADYETLVAKIKEKNKEAVNKSYADFAHQCITAATEYDVRRGAISVEDPFFSGGAQERAQYTGWMGDCVLVGVDGGERTTLGPDDYKADLDANNISVAAFDGSVSYQAAARQYYSDLDNHSYTRATKFLENNGGYDNVVNQVYENLSKANDPAAVLKGQVTVSGPDVSRIVVVPEVCGATTVTEYVDHSVSEEIEIIGRYEKLRDTSTFLEALKNGDNELPG